MLLNAPGRFPPDSGPPTSSGRVMIYGADTLYTSADAITWTSRTVPTGNWTAAARVPGGKVLIVNRDTTTGSHDAAYSSDDGATWTGIGAGSLSADVANYYAIAHDGTTTVIVGGANTEGMAKTTDVTSTWTDVVGDTSLILEGIIWVSSLSLFIAHATIGGGSGYFIITSPDGSTWTSRTSPDSDRTWARGMAWNGTKLVAFGRNSLDDTPRVLTSTNGTTWSESTPGLTKLATYWDKVIWDGSKFVALGNAPTTGTATDGVIATSTDGTTWADSYITAGDYPDDLIVIPGYYAVRAGTNLDEIWTSVNLLTWNHVSDRSMTGNPLGWAWVPD